MSHNDLNKKLGKTKVYRDEDSSDFLEFNFYMIIGVVIVLIISLLILYFVGLKRTFIMAILVTLIVVGIKKYYDHQKMQRILAEIAEEDYKDANTVFKKYDKSLVIAGALRDVADTCAGVLSTIDSVRKQFEKCTVILYENDSKDDTVNIVKKWAMGKKDVVLLLNQVNEGKSRTERIGIARQKIVDYAKKDPLLRGYDYLLCLDFGTENASKKLSNTIHHAVDTMIDKPNVMGIFPSGDFYDSWPLRIKGVVEYDVHKKFINQFYTWWINHKMNKIIDEAREKGEMIEVDSAFGGAALYRLKDVINSGTEYDGTETCEHTSFNLGLFEGNPEGILVIHPKFEIGLWTSSYTSKLS
jgi:uncharacterized membrane protein